MQSTWDNQTLIPPKILRRTPNDYMNMQKEAHLLVKLLNLLTVCENIYTIF